MVTVVGGMSKVEKGAKTLGRRVCPTERANISGWEEEGGLQVR